MTKSKFIRVFEYQKIRYDNPNNEFQKTHFDAMVRFNEKNQNKFFTIIYNGIQFNNYVGVLSIGELTIEILPKIDRNSNPNAEIWQRALLDMLSISGNIHLNSVSQSPLRKKDNSILALYFQLYLSEIENLIKLGFIKKYRRTQQNKTTLKGKIIFSKHIQRNLINKEKVFCEHSIYDKDHLLNQILLKGLKILDTIWVGKPQDRVYRLLLEFQDIKKISITSEHFQRIKLHRKSQSYSKAIEIAKMIILNYSPDITFGKNQMIAILFDMNMLWEEYIYKILLKYRPKGVSVSFQNSKKFWEYKTVRPDIVIRDQANKVFVIDTKWKMITNNNPSDEDLKQIFTYNLYWQAEKSLLLYPLSNQKDSLFGKYHHIPQGKSKNSCKLAFISVLDDNGRIHSQKMAEAIYNKFESESLLN